MRESKYAGTSVFHHYSKHPWMWKVITDHRKEEADRVKWTSASANQGGSTETKNPEREDWAWIASQYLGPEEGLSVFWEMRARLGVTSFCNWNEKEQVNEMCEKNFMFSDHRHFLDVPYPTGAPSAHEPVGYAGLSAEQKRSITYRYIPGTRGCTYGQARKEFEAVGFDAANARCPGVGRNAWCSRGTPADWALVDATIYVGSLQYVFQQREYVYAFERQCGGYLWVEDAGQRLDDMPCYCRMGHRGTPILRTLYCRDGEYLDFSHSDAFQDARCRVCSLEACEVSPQRLHAPRPPQRRTGVTVGLTPLRPQVGEKYIPCDGFRQDAGCQPCTNKPEHSEYTTTGTETQDCEWRCSPGFFLDRGGGNVCSQCTWGSEFATNAGDALTGCPAHHVLSRLCGGSSDGLCTPCPAGTERRSTMAQCEDCPPQQMSLQGEACKACPSGKYREKKEGPCVDCQADSEALANARYVPGYGRDFCVIVCNKGFAKNENGICVQCEPRFTSDGTGGGCYPCYSPLNSEFPAGKTYESDPCDWVCKPGYELDASGTRCEACAKGSSNSVQNGRCAPCAPGYFAPAPASTECLFVPAGHVTEAPGAFAPVPCPIGLKQDPSGAACTACAAGEYQRLSGQTTCLPCPPGSEASERRDRCVPCKPGTVRGVTARADEGCSPCAVGTYQPNVQQTSCLDCAGAQLACGVGQYDVGCLAVGSTQVGCAACSGPPQGTTPATTAHFTSPGQVRGRPDSCQFECPVGSFFDGRCRSGPSDCRSDPANSRGCAPCTKSPCGTGNDGHPRFREECLEPGRLEDARCVRCEDSGRLLPTDSEWTSVVEGMIGAGACSFLCEAGFMRSSVGDARCLECRAFDGSRAADCTCPAGQFLVEGDTTVQCSMCPDPNSFDEDPGNAQCVCRVGFWGDPVNSKSCVRCPPGATTAASGKQRQEDCSCMQGFHGDPRTGALARCVQCYAGEPFYCPGGIGGAQPCPPHSRPRAGLASSIEDCKPDTGFYVGTSTLSDAWVILACAPSQLTAAPGSRFRQASGGFEERNPDCPRECDTNLGFVADPSTPGSCVCAEGLVRSTELGVQVQDGALACLCRPGTLDVRQLENSRSAVAASSVAEACGPCPEGQVCLGGANAVPCPPRTTTAPGVSADALANCSCIFGAQPGPDAADSPSCSPCSPGLECLGGSALQSCRQHHFCPGLQNISLATTDARFVELARRDMVRPCPSGSFSDALWLASAEECQPCPLGQYCAVVNGTNLGPQACPGAAGSMTTLAPGASTPEECVCLAGFEMDPLLHVCNACPAGSVTTWPRLGEEPTECRADPSYNCSALVPPSRLRGMLQAWNVSVVLDPGVLPAPSAVSVDPLGRTLVEDALSGSLWDVGQAQWLPHGDARPGEIRGPFELAEDGLSVSAGEFSPLFRAEDGDTITGITIHPDGETLLLTTASSASVQDPALRACAGGGSAPAGGSGAKLHAANAATGAIVEVHALPALFVPLAIAVFEDGQTLMLAGASLDKSSGAVVFSLRASTPPLFLSEWRSAPLQEVALWSTAADGESYGTQVGRVVSLAALPGLPRSAAAVVHRCVDTMQGRAEALPHVVAMVESCVPCPRGAVRGDASAAGVGSSARQECMCLPGSRPSFDTAAAPGLTAARPLSNGAGSGASVPGPLALCVPCGRGEVCSDGVSSELCPSFSPLVTSHAGNDRPENCFCREGHFAYPACTPCLRNHFCPGLGPGFRDMVPCSPWAQSPGGQGATSSAACLCDDGYLPAPAEAGADHACELCPPDSYCRGGQRYDCPPSTPHTLPGERGATSEAQCVCGDGHVIDPSNGNCVECGIGAFCERLEGGQPVRQACPPGQTTRSATATRVQECLCPAGFTQSAVFPHHCTLCPQGFVCDGLSAEPRPCPDGLSTVLPNSTVLQKALDPETGAVDFLKLPPGAASVSECSCGAGKHRVAIGVAADLSPQFLCQYCSKSHYCPDGLTMLPCPVPRTTAEGEVATSLAECRCLEPYAEDVTGGQGCGCQAGFVSLPGNTCERCPDGLTSDAGRARDVDVDCVCPAGSFDTTAARLAADRRCQLCPAGFVCEQGEDPAPCPPGTYLPLVGATDSSWCLACMDAQNSEAPGAIRIEECSHAFLRLHNPPGFDATTTRTDPVVKIDFVLRNLCEVNAAVRDAAARAVQALLQGWAKSPAALMRVAEGAGISAQQASRVYDTPISSSVVSSYVPQTEPAPAAVFAGEAFSGETIRFAGAGAAFETGITVEIVVPEAMLHALMSLQRVRATLAGSRAIHRSYAVALAVVWALTEFVEDATTKGGLTDRLVRELAESLRGDTGAAAKLADAGAPAGASLAEGIAWLGPELAMKASGALANLKRVNLPFRLPNPAVHALAERLVVNSELRSNFLDDFSADDFSSQFRYTMSAQRGAILDTAMLLSGNGAYNHYTYSLEPLLDESDKLVLTELEPPRQVFDVVSLVENLRTESSRLAQIEPLPCPPESVLLGIAEARTEFCVRCPSSDFFDSRTRTCRRCSALSRSNCSVFESFSPCNATADAHCHVCDDCNRCGDGLVGPAETCDTAIHRDPTCCTEACRNPPGFYVSRGPQGRFECTSRCGDGAVADGAEECDDANTFNGDGCSAECKVEKGYDCVLRESDSRMGPLRDAWASQPYMSVCQCAFCVDGVPQLLDWFTLDPDSLGAGALPLPGSPGARATASAAAIGVTGFLLLFLLSGLSPHAL